jgi:hypothetical protein
MIDTGPFLARSLRGSPDVTRHGQQVRPDPLLGGPGRWRRANLRLCLQTRRHGGREASWSRIAYLFLSGKDKEAIAAELKAAFKLPDTQAVKIVRRITGRARFFQRVDELMTAK